MLLLFSTLILLHHISSLSGYLSTTLQGVTPISSTAINITWVIKAVSDINNSTDGGVTLEIDVCGISSTYVTTLQPQNASSINIQQSFIVSDLQPDFIYYACLGANWTSADNMTQNLQYPCSLVRTYMADNTTLNPIPSIRNVIWQQLWNLSTPTVYVDVLLARELAFSPSAEVQFGSQPVVQDDINTPLNNTYLMHRFIFDNLDTPPQDYNLMTTIYLLAKDSQCSYVRVGYVDTTTVKTTTSQFSTTTVPNNSGERVSALYWSTLILFIGLMYYDL